MTSLLVVPRGVSRFVSAMTAVLALTSFVTGCTKSEGDRGPVVTKLEVQPDKAPPAAAAKLQKVKEINAAARTTGDASAASRLTTTPSTGMTVKAQVTLRKAALFDRVFLYSSDLQYSSLHEEGYDLYLQSMALSHQPAYFRLVDDRLQLLADQRHLFESDVNHPERLLHEFKVLEQTDETLTVEMRSASPTMATVIGGEKAPVPRSTWVRSAEYVEDAQLMLIETSVEMADGQIAEFMEAFAPREKLIPADAKPIFATAEHEPHAERYRFLDQGELFLEVPDKGRVKTKVASRFYVKPGETVIDWYVTPNVPDAHVNDIKTGVEAWNRYSQKMWGKDIVRFAGKLPAGVKLGDPRYNVINWDSIAQAGAAYESQATDPYTGIQTHSLIYLPAAWVNIGKTFWERGGTAEETSRARINAIKARIQSSKFLGKKVDVRCLRDALDTISLTARATPDEFARELLKGVLFHEMGHAMGLAHNFKASLSYENDQDAASFTTSIMDYNQFQLESAAFTSLESADGPLLEYDRQIMSVLYNGGKDVTETDPKLPACEDSESDNEEGGIDPLCIRYDAGKDPTAQLARTIDLTRNESAKMGKTKSLPASLKGLVTELGDPAAVTTPEQLQASAVKFLKTGQGLILYYYASGAQSVAAMTGANVRMLRQFNGDLPTGYDEMAMRTRAAQAFRYVMALESLDPAVTTAATEAKAAAKAWMEKTAWYASTPAEMRDAVVAALSQALDQFPTAIEGLALSATRTRVLATATASEKAGWFLLDDGTSSVDFEREVAQTLARIATTKLASGTARPVGERNAAATVLKTYLKTAVGAGFVNEASLALQAEARTARTAKERQEAITVYRTLTAE